MKTETERKELAAYMRHYRSVNPKYRLYDVWKLIIRRCNNPNTGCYPVYGGRGIKICEEWMSFENFYEWAHANGYVEGLQIDRIDSNGNYEPSNCRFVTSMVNNRNRRNNKLTEQKVREIRDRLSAGESGSKLAREYGVHHSLIYRIKQNKQWVLNPTN